MRKKDKEFMRLKMKSSYELAERGKKCLSAHYTTGFFDEFLFFDHGKGSKIYDPDGNEYIDFAMALGPLILGHANEAVESAVIEAIKKGTVHGLGHTYEIEFAEMLVDALGSTDMVTFANSGTEATMFALKCARAYTGKEKVAKFQGHYHGTHDYAQVSGRTSDSGPIEAPLTTPDNGGIPKFVVDNMITLTFNHSSAISIIKENKDQLAAVIVEPIPLFYPMKCVEFLRELREVTRENNVLLIFDEVVTGFRFCYGGMMEYIGIEADLSTYGKLVGGGFPIGVVAGKKEYMDIFRYDTTSLPGKKKISVTGTFSGNPVTCAAGIATLKELKSNQCAYEQMEKRAIFIKNEVEAYANKLGYPLQIQTMGSIMVPYFFKGEIRNPRETDWKTNILRFNILRKHMVKNGVNLSEVGAMFLSTAHTDEDCEIAVEAFKKSIDELF